MSITDKARARTIWSPLTKRTSSRPALDSLWIGHPVWNAHSRLRHPRRYGISHTISTRAHGGPPYPTFGLGNTSPGTTRNDRHWPSPVTHPGPQQSGPPICDRKPFQVVDRWIHYYRQIPLKSAGSDPRLVPADPRRVPASPRLPILLGENATTRRTSKPWNAHFTQVEYSK